MIELPWFLSALAINNNNINIQQYQHSTTTTTISTQTKIVYRITQLPISFLKYFWNKCLNKTEFVDFIFGRKRKYENHEFSGKAGQTVY